jgi:hypothetical protein
VSLCDGVIGDKSVRQAEPSRSWRWSSTQLEPGELRLDCTGLDLDTISICAATINRVSIHRLQAPEDTVSLLICQRHGGMVFVSGHELTPARCLCIDSGAEVDLVAHRESAFLLLTVRKGLLTRAVGLFAPRTCGPSARIALLACSIDARAALEERIGSILQDSFMHRNRDAAAAEGLRRMTTTLLVSAAELVTTPARTARSNARAGMQPSSLRAGTYTSIWQIDPAGGSVQQYTLQARSLEYGFQEVVRLSPMRYVRMLRLGEVRRQILEGAPYDAAYPRSLWMQASLISASSPSTTRRCSPRRHRRPGNARSLPSRTPLARDHAPGSPAVRRR